MNWHHPVMVRGEMPPLPAWWLWLALPVAGIALAALGLFFTWPLQRGFTDPRFWIYLLLLPMLLSLAVNAFMLSAALQARRKVIWRQLFIDHKRAQWQHWGRRSLYLSAWHCLTPEADLAPRLLGLEGSQPEPPAMARALAAGQDPVLGTCRLTDIFSQLLNPLQTQWQNQLLPEIWLWVNTEQQQASQALRQSWLTQQNHSLADDRLHWLSTPPDAGLFADWCDQTFIQPRLLLVIYLREEGIPLDEFAVALLMQPPNCRTAKNSEFRSLYLFRPLISSADKLEQDLPALLAVQQTDIKRLQHLWDSGLTRRQRLSLYALLDEQGVDLPAKGRHELVQQLGPAVPASLWLALVIAAQAGDLAQRGQWVAAEDAQTLSILQLSTQPAAKVDLPQTELPRYPLTYLCAIFALLLVLLLLPVDPQTQQMMLPWLAGGFVLVAGLLSFAMPLEQQLWRKQWDAEWSRLEENPDD